MRMLNKYLLSIVLLIIQSLCLFACTPLTPAETGSARSTAPWEGRLRDLFNDSIDPSAVGLTGISSSNAGGAVSARAEEAQFIVRVRVATVTTEGVGKDLRYLITLRVIGDPIAGPRTPGDTIQISIGQDNPTFGIAKAKDMQLAGVQFIGFLREFNQLGTPVMHWHLARDGQDVLDAVRNVAVLSEVSED